MGTWRGIGTAWDQGYAPMGSSETPPGSFDSLSGSSSTPGSIKESKSGSISPFHSTSKQNLFEAFIEPSVIRAEVAAQPSEASGAPRAVTEMCRGHCRVTGARLWLRSHPIFITTYRFLTRDPLSFSLTHFFSICASSTKRALPICTFHTFLLHHAAPHFAPPLTHHRQPSFLPSFPLPKR